MGTGFGLRVGVSTRRLTCRVTHTHDLYFQECVSAGLHTTMTPRTHARTCSCRHAHPDIKAYSPRRNAAYCHFPPRTQPLPNRLAVSHHTVRCNSTSPTSFLSRSLLRPPPFTGRGLPRRSPRPHAAEARALQDERFLRAGPRGGTGNDTRHRAQGRPRRAHFRGRPKTSPRGSQGEPPRVGPRRGCGRAARVHRAAVHLADAPYADARRRRRCRRWWWGREWRRRRRPRRAVRRRHTR